MVDAAASYFGMRRASVAPDARGTPRVRINGRVEMQIGMLDQGFWSDGLYTAPTGAAARPPPPARRPLTARPPPACRGPPLPARCLPAASRRCPPAACPPRAAALETSAAAGG